MTCVDIFEFILLGACWVSWMEPSMYTLFLRYFFQVFGQSLALSGITASSSLMLNNCSWLFLTNTQGIELSSLSLLWVRQIKISIMNGTFPGSCQTGQVMTILYSFMEMGLLGALQTHSAPFSDCYATGFHRVHSSKAVGFQGYHRAWESGWEESKLKYHKACCSCQDGFLK